VAAHLPLQVPGTWRKQRRPHTLDEVPTHASRRDPMFPVAGGGGGADSGLMRGKWLVECDSLFKRNLSAVM
jgi:hypothetical protein